MMLTRALQRLYHVGTPAGVGPIKVGDTVTAGMGYDVRTVRFKVVPKPKVLKR